MRKRNLTTTLKLAAGSLALGAALAGSAAAQPFTTVTPNLGGGYTIHRPPQMPGFGFSNHFHDFGNSNSDND